MVNEGVMRGALREHFRHIKAKFAWRAYQGSPEGANPTNCTEISKVILLESEPDLNTRRSHSHASLPSDIGARYLALGRSVTPMESNVIAANAIPICHGKNDDLLTSSKRSEPQSPIHSRHTKLE